MRFNRRTWCAAGLLTAVVYGVASYVILKEYRLREAHIPTAEPACAEVLLDRRSRRTVSVEVGASRLYPRHSELDNVDNTGLSLTLRPLRRVSVHILDESRVPVEDAIAGTGFWNVKRSSGELQQFILRKRTNSRPRMYELKLADDIEHDTAILSSQGGGVLTAAQLRTLSGSHAVTVSPREFVTGRVAEDGGERHGCAVTVKFGGGRSNSFETGSDGMFCIYVGRSRPEELLVECGAQTKRIRAPRRGQFYETVFPAIQP